MIGIIGFAALYFGARRLPAGTAVGLAAIWWALLAFVQSPLIVQPNPVGGLLGGNLTGWLIVGMLAVPVVGYRLGLKALRRRVDATPPPPAPPRTGFAAVELERYARHIMLREIGGPGQGQLQAARVLVVGAGGLGSPAMMYLAASGVGQIGVIDADVVENSNLQRQIIHTDDRIGMPKVHSAVAAMGALNPFITLRAYDRRLDASTAALLDEYDLVLDGTDNFDTRYLVNRLCVAAGKPLIAAAITQWEGQISLYDPARGGPCFECVFPTRPADGLAPSCAEGGVAAPLPGVMGAMMAMEAVKYLTGAGQGLRGRIMLYDGLYAEARVIAAPARAGCPVCGARALDIPDASVTLP
ncbi:Molybdopterin or thiamine biosynthesis adenylyltransferase [Pseudorhodobacter antarcticus]|jgi:molybdopterin/thiamine biosynthesis adenylyltransferase|uniref:Molybdopterin-synthase adenylyltransferase n=1 Tax=Pseudorhodobacter antarcticus TaxID=1077947 RepID=A0A1H8AZU8_9RHOB|nr:HesA/MoeB/ThiF family protein [Pseudorhodobacter antarcticus]SEM76260.1 Molybdopterin or thiamine biosynthesis adenylyltransferase [Pseudorhodobacter antarcticus]